MASILTEIAQRRKADLQADKLKAPLSLLQALAQEAAPARDFVAALQSKPTLLRKTNPKYKIIAECKRRSPSEAMLSTNYDAASIARAYERAGASAISVLTEPNYFAGNWQDLRAVSKEVCIPVLCKDFISDPYQVWQARAHGADAFILIANFFDFAALQYLIEIGRELGMEALVEAHSQEGLNLALQTDARMVSVNTRNPDTWDVDLSPTKALSKQLKSDKSNRVFVCDSDFSNQADLKLMASSGFHAFLCGEALSTDPKKH